MNPPNPDHGPWTIVQELQPWTIVQEHEENPAQVRYRVGLVGGRRVITHLCVEPNPKASSVVGITARDLSAIKPAELLAQDEAFMRLMLDPTQGMTVRPTRYGDAEYAAIRDLLVRSEASGTSARAVLMKSWAVTPRTADRLIAETRKRYPDAPQATRSGGRGGTS